MTMLSGKLQNREGNQEVQYTLVENNGTLLVHDSEKRWWTLQPLDAELPNPNKVPGAYERFPPAYIARAKGLFTDRSGRRFLMTTPCQGKSFLSLRNAIPKKVLTLAEILKLTEDILRALEELKDYLPPAPSHLNPRTILIHLEAQPVRASLLCWMQGENWLPPELGAVGPDQSLDILQGDHKEATRGDDLYSLVYFFLQALAYHEIIPARIPSEENEENYKRHLLSVVEGCYANIIEDGEFRKRYITLTPKEENFFAAKIKPFLSKILELGACYQTDEQDEPTDAVEEGENQSTSEVNLGDVAADEDMIPSHPNLELRLSWENFLAALIQEVSYLQDAWRLLFERRPINSKPKETKFFYLNPCPFCPSMVQVDENMDRMPFPSECRIGHRLHKDLWKKFCAVCLGPLARLEDTLCPHCCPDDMKVLDLSSPIEKEEEMDLGTTWCCPKKEGQEKELASTKRIDPKEEKEMDLPARKVKIWKPLQE